MRYRRNKIIIIIIIITNAESERSLSIKARVVTKERASLGESAIVGLRLVKEAVRFHDPVNFAPENIPITKELKLSVQICPCHISAETRRRESGVPEEER